MDNNLTPTKRIEFLEKHFDKLLKIVDRQTDLLEKFSNDNKELLEFKKLIMDEKQAEKDMWLKHFDRKNDEIIETSIALKNKFFDK